MEDMCTNLAIPNWGTASCKSYPITDNVIDPADRFSQALLPLETEEGARIGGHQPIDRLMFKIDIIRLLGHFGILISSFNI